MISIPGLDDSDIRVGEMLDLIIDRLLGNRHHHIISRGSENVRVLHFAAFWLNEFSVKFTVCAVNMMADDNMLTNRYCHIKGAVPFLY